MTENLKTVYVDDEDNLLFEDFYLEEISKKEAELSNSSSSEDTIKKLLEKVLESKQQTSEVKNLSKIANDFMIEKFDEKNSNSNQWINEFEKECVRCVIEEDRNKIDIESEWNNCKKNFIDTFGNKGWSPIRYAFTFKYQSGYSLDHALKKEEIASSNQKIYRY